MNEAFLDTEEQELMETLEQDGWPQGMKPIRFELTDDFIDICYDNVFKASVNVTSFRKSPALIAKPSASFP